MMLRDAPRRTERIAEAIVTVVTCLLPSRQAAADEVIMSNGDRLTGKVVRTDQSTLRLETDYAGTLSINWSKVQTVRFDEPRKVLLDDECGGSISEMSRDAGEITLQKEAPPLAISGSSTIASPICACARVSQRGRAIVSSRGRV